MLSRKKRTDSKNELNGKVNSNGFALFVIGLTLAGFLGGAMRLFLNSENVQAFMITEVRKKLPGWEVDAALVQLHLASGIWPGVTVDLPKAKLVHRANCKDPSLKVEVRSLKVPVSLWAVVRGKNTIGRVSVEHIDVEILDEPCGTSQPVAPSAASAATAVAPAEVKSPAPSRLGFRKFHEEITSKIEGLSVAQITVSRPKFPDWSFSGQNLQLRTNSRIDLRGDFSIWKMFPQGEIRQYFKLHGVLTGPLLEWEISSGVKEGSLVWQGQLDDEGRTFLQRLRIRQGPLGDVLDLLYRAGMVNHRKDTKRVWINCEAAQGGHFSSFEALAQIPVRLESCRMDGEIGQVIISPQVFYVRRPYLRNGPAVIDAHQLSLDLLADVLNIPKMSVLFSHLGIWTGKISVESLEKVLLKGTLTDLRINVSNKSLRGVETLSRVETQGEWNPWKTHFTLSDFQILGGSRGGTAAVDFFAKEKRGRFEVDFEGLSPSEPIQNLLFQGRSEPLKLNIEGFIVNGKVSGLRADVNSSEAWGRGWRFSKPKAQLRQVKDELFRARLDGALFQWNGSFKYLRLIDSIRVRTQSRARSQSQADLEKSLKDVHLDLNLSSNGGEVERGSAQWESKRIEFTGQWRRGEDLTGKFRLDKSPWMPVTVSR